VGFLYRALGYFYPALASSKAAVQQDKAAYTQWMTYWVVFSVIGIFELIFDKLSAWIPFYMELKSVFIIWLAMPRFQGASQIYLNWVEPYLTKYENKIDEHIEIVQNRATTHVKSFVGNCVQRLTQHLQDTGNAMGGQLLLTVMNMWNFSKKPEAPSAEKIKSEGQNSNTGIDFTERKDSFDIFSLENGEEFLEDFKALLKNGLLVKLRENGEFFSPATLILNEFENKIIIQNHGNCCPAVGLREIQKVAEDSKKHTIRIDKKDTSFFEIQLSNKEDASAVYVGLQLMIQGQSTVNNQ